MEIQPLTSLLLHKDRFYNIIEEVLHNIKNCIYGPSLVKEFYDLVMICVVQSRRDFLMYRKETFS